MNSIPIGPRAAPHVQAKPIAPTSPTYVLGGIYFSGNRSTEKSVLERTGCFSPIGQFFARQYHKLFPSRSRQHSDDTSSESSNPFQLTSDEPGVEHSQPAESNRTSTAHFSPKSEIELYNQYIDDGLSLIRNGQPEKAIQHFRNPTALTRVGYRFGTPACSIQTRIPTNPKDINRIVHFQAQYSMCYFRDKQVNLSTTYFLDPQHRSAELRPKTPEEKAVLFRIRYEEALVSAEEHLHVLQALRGKNITYQPDTGVDQDLEFDPEEIDVALTLESKAVPMTDNFLARYNRRDYIKHSTSHTGSG